MARPPRVNSGSGSGTPSRAANKGGIIALDLLWPRINARTDAEREFGTPVLTEVPNLTRAELRDRGIHHLSRSRLASFREAHRMLRTSSCSSAPPTTSHPMESLGRANHCSSQVLRSC